MQATRVLKNNPEAMWHHDMKDFRDYIESFGAKIPTLEDIANAQAMKEDKTEAEDGDEGGKTAQEQEEEEESEMLDEGDIVKEEDGDVDPVPDMGDTTKEPADVRHFSSTSPC